MIEDATEDAAYTALLSSVDPSDFSGALRDVCVSDAMRRPLHFAKAVADLSIEQAGVGVRALRRMLGRRDDGKLAPGDTAFRDRAWQLNPCSGCGGELPRDGALDRDDDGDIPRSPRPIAARRVLRWG